VNRQQIASYFVRKVIFRRISPFEFKIPPNLFRYDEIYLLETMDEQQAIQRLKQGDIGGLEFLVSQFQLQAVRVSYLITRDE
jgi:hypothetical protein